MEKSTESLRIEFEVFIKENLTYESLSKMSFDQYSFFVFNLFKKIDNLKRQGIEKDLAIEFINKHFSFVMESADDTDILFERRFSAITEEITEFCSNPFFWETDFVLYMQKWEKLFQIDWFKKV